MRCKEEVTGFPTHSRTPPTRVVLFYVLRKIRYVITLKDFRRAALVRR